MAAGDFFPTLRYREMLLDGTVTLDWTTRGIPRTRSLTTYIARDGIQNYVY